MEHAAGEDLINCIKIPQMNDLEPTTDGTFELSAYIPPEPPPLSSKTPLDFESSDPEISRI